MVFRLQVCCNQFSISNKWRKKNFKIYFQVMTSLTSLSSSHSTYIPIKVLGTNGKSSIELRIDWKARIEIGVYVVWIQRLRIQGLEKAQFWPVHSLVVLMETARSKTTIVYWHPWKGARTLIVQVHPLCVPIMDNWYWTIWSDRVVNTAWVNKEIKNTNVVRQLMSSTVPLRWEAKSSIS